MQWLTQQRYRSQKASFLLFQMHYFMRRIYRLALLLSLPILTLSACDEKDGKEKPRVHSETISEEKQAHFRKTSNAVLQSILENDTARFNTFIQPEIGLYVVYRTGAFDSYSNIQKTEDDETVSFRFGVFEIQEKQDLKASIQYGTLPVYDCDGPMDRDEDGWSKRGYFADTTNQYTPVSLVAADRKEYFEEELSEKERIAIATVEENSVKVVFTGEEDVEYGHGGVTFYLIYDDGQWWISVLDWLFNDCGV